MGRWLPKKTHLPHRFGFLRQTSPDHQALSLKLDANVLVQVVDGNVHWVQEDLRIDPHDQGQHDQWQEGCQLTLVQVHELTLVLRFDVSKGHSVEQP